MRPKLPTRHLSAALAVGLAMLTAGCGPQVVPVTGKALLADGKPLPAGTRLIFNPAEGKKGGASAVVAEDGSFRVTHVSGAGGAEEGKYLILLAAPAGKEESFFKSIPKKYYEGGELHVEVKPGMQPLELKVETARGS